MITNRLPAISRPCIPSFKAVNEAQFNDLLKKYDLELRTAEASPKTTNGAYEAFLRTKDNQRVLVNIYQGRTLVGTLHGEGTTPQKAESNYKKLFPEQGDLVIPFSFAVQN